VLDSTKKFVESEQARAGVGTIRRKPFDNVATMPAELRSAAMAYAQRTLDTFIEEVVWSLGDEGRDCRFDDRHSYRFRIELGIVDSSSNEVVEEVAINRNGPFFGKNWGHWLNRYGAHEERIGPL
jgi:hypothetical protein